MPKRNKSFSLSDEALRMLKKLNEWQHDATGQKNESLVIEVLIRQEYADKAEGSLLND